MKTLKAVLYSFCYWHSDTHFILNLCFNNTFQIYMEENWLSSKVLTLKSHLPFDNGSQPN